MMAFGNTIVSYYHMMGNCIILPPGTDMQIWPLQDTDVNGIQDELTLSQNCATAASQISAPDQTGSETQNNGTQI